MPSPHEYHWTFGNRCHIEFPGGGDPLVRAPHAFNTFEGCATISDNSGNLLFYTDGDGLYDTLTGPNIQSGLGGSRSSTHSAIIVPPAGGGSHYHIFTVHDWDNNAANGGNSLWHTSVSVSPVAIESGPTQLTNPIFPEFASERLAAIPHTDCSKYWVIAFDIGSEDKSETNAPTIHSILIDSDTAPTTSNTQTYPVMGTSSDTIIGMAFCVKFSPDGSMLAVTKPNGIDLLNFDRASGAFTFHSQITGLSTGRRPYGVEFSPNNLYLYYTTIFGGELRRHDISLGTQAYSTDPLIATEPDGGRGNYRLGALQLGPNGKIYGTQVSEPSLLEIADPNNSDATAVGFDWDAKDANGNKLDLTSEGAGNADLGLPTFTRIADDCLDEDVCASVANDVNEITSERAENDVNRMRPCEGRLLQKPACRELRLPRVRPFIDIKWGNSECDCIESDDTEIVSITVCNIYSNIEFSDFTIHKLEVVDANGDPVATLPDGTPSVELTPIGPYCFGTIESCSCVSREFVLRNRGAIAGEYHIRATGICYDVNLHFDEEACFKFDICAD